MKVRIDKQSPMVGNADEMAEDFVRQLIHKKLHEGRLPRTRAVDIWVAPGEGQLCDGCGAPIPARISFIAREAEYTSPIIYSKENRASLVFMVEARPSPQDAGRLHPGQPLEVRPAGKPTGHPS